MICENFVQHLSNILSKLRILFLVDRKALATQAVRKFNSFQTPHSNKFNQEYKIYSQKFRREDFADDEPFNPKILPTEYLTNPSNSQTFVYVSRIQRMTTNLSVLLRFPFEF